MKALVALCCCFPLWIHAEIFDAKIIAVMDGDTVMVLRGAQKIKVRLANIDAPEKDQSYGEQSRLSLLEMVWKKQVRINSQATDQYGRTVGLVSLGALDINQEQVKRGMAWEYSHYHADKTDISLQGEAQQAHRGLWAEPNPEAPWLWRSQHVADASTIQSPSAATTYSDAACGKKHRCSEMNSCEEAYFYLTRCDVQTLDGNRDGIPCESLCRGK